jgi:hypothetical protein
LKNKSTVYIFKVEKSLEQVCLNVYYCKYTGHMLVLDTEDDYDDGPEFNPANHQVREGVLAPWTIEYIGNIEAKSRYKSSGQLPGRGVLGP